MSSLLRFVWCATVVGLLLLPPAAACADGNVQPTVALIVDVQRVLDESEAAKGVQKQLDSQRARFQTETEKEENQLRQSEQELGKAHDHLSADAYTDREQQLRQRLIRLWQQCFFRSRK